MQFRIATTRTVAAAVTLAALIGITACSSGSDDEVSDGSSSSTASTATTVPDRSDAAPVTTTVFRSGEGGYAAFRIPAVVQTRNGMILAFAEGRKVSANDAGDVDLVLRRSADGGATWSPLQVVGQDKANFVGNPSPVVDATSGRVAVLATHKNGLDDETAIVIGKGVDTSRVWLYRSDDDGATWSTGKDITSSVKRPEWGWYTVGPGHAVQLTTGAHTGRMVAPANHSDARTGLGNNTLLSDDGGLTWRIGAVADPTGGPRPDESTSAEMPDGTIVFSTRNQDDAATWHRLRSTSADGGETYAEPFAPQVGLVVPIVQGSLLWSGAGSEGSSGSGSSTGRLLFSAPAAPTDRVDLTVRSSTDAGVTWSQGTLIAPGPAGYSDLVALRGGLVGDLHEAGTAAPDQRIDLTVIGVDRLR